MNKVKHISDGRAKPGHVNARSYVIGFLLSVVLTAAAYYLVVSQSVSGTALLATILGFAFIQLLVQIFFFLHLGRGPNKYYDIVFFVMTVGIIVLVVGGSLFIMKNLDYNMLPSEVLKKVSQSEGISQLGDKPTGACAEVYTNHQVVISDGSVSPNHTNANICDSLTFINEDDGVREISFGVHPEHSGYAGQDELILRKGRAKTITLNQAGSYNFHDHLDPEVAGSFIVVQ